MEIGKEEEAKWLKEMARLEEMAIRTISQPEDGLPFAICIRDPETKHKNDPHAHLYEAKKKGVDLGIRLRLSPSVPQSVEDIKDAFPTKKYNPIPDNWKMHILTWAKKPNKIAPKITNWEQLWYQWCYSVNAR